MQGCFTTTVILRYFPKREYTHGYSGLLYGHFMNKVNKRNPTILRFPNFNKLPVSVIGVIVPVFITLLVFTCFFVHLSYVLLYAIRQFFILALQNELHCSKKSPDFQGWMVIHGLCPWKKSHSIIIIISRLPPTFIRHIAADPPAACRCTDFRFFCLYIFCMFMPERFWQFPEQRLFIALQITPDHSRILRSSFLFIH